MNARVFIVGLVAAVAAATASSVARAETADCGKAVIEAWDKGRLDSSFAPACYRKALQELPEDIRIYSSADDDINRALIASLARQSRTYRSTAQGAVKGIVRKLSSTATSKAVRQQAAAAAADPNAGTVPLTVLISGAGAVVLVGAAGISVVARRLRRHASPSS
jgi:hypothetical protein